MKTPEKEYFSNFLAETPNHVSRQFTETKKSSKKSMGFFSCCAKEDNESEINMTRNSLRPIV